MSCICMMAHVAGGIVSSHAENELIVAKYLASMISKNMTSIVAYIILTN